MDVDPAGSTDPPPAATPSLKRPQEAVVHEETNGTSKRQKPDEPEAIEVDDDIKAEEGGEAAEASSQGAKGKEKEKGKGQRDGGRNKRQRGKKGDEKGSERNRRRGTRPEGEAAPTPEDGEPKAPRLPKRQCALLIGFCGDGYNGMQMCVFTFGLHGVEDVFITRYASVNRIQSYAPSKACCSTRSSRTSTARVRDCSSSSSSQCLRRTSTRAPSTS